MKKCQDFKVNDISVDRHCLTKRKIYLQIQDRWSILNYFPFFLPFGNFLLSFAVQHLWKTTLEMMIISVINVINGLAEKDGLCYLLFVNRTNISSTLTKKILLNRCFNVKYGTHVTFAWVLRTSRTGSKPLEDPTRRHIINRQADIFQKIDKYRLIYKL